MNNIKNKNENEHHEKYSAQKNGLENPSRFNFI
jgi:hypothetical protein